MKTEVVYRGMGCGQFVHILTLIFVVMKLTHNIDWSWWWVFAPSLILIGTGVGLLCAVAVITIMAIVLTGPAS